MKQILTSLILLLLPLFAFGQEINSFDEAPADTNYWIHEISENADPTLSFVNISYVTDPLFEGAGAMQLEYSAHNIESWGGYAKIYHMHPDTGSVWDWSGYDSISFSYYNSVAQSEAGRINLRFNLSDYGDADPGYTGLGEYYYSFHYVLDNEPGWNTITMPLERNDSWDGAGFNLTGWAGDAGNGELDTDAIAGFHFEFSVSGGGDGDHVYGTVVLDDFTLKGRKPTNLVFFNGLTTPPDVELYGGWSGTGSASISYGTGTDPDNSPNSIQWNTPTNPFSDEWGLFFIDRETNPRDLGTEWSTDSLKFFIKADAGFGNLYVILFDADQDGYAGGTEDIEMTAQFVVQSGDVGYDGTWKNVIIPLASFNRFSGGWDPSQEAWIDGEMDSTKIGGLKFQVASGSDAGIVVHFDNLWTGNPEFDVIAPNAPENVGAVPATYYNLVTWSDVSGESGEVYNAYASLEPITDLDLPEVDVVAFGMLEGTQAAVHYLYAPLEDASVSYYYAVVCVDASGNESELGTSDGSVTNAAMGIPTISLDVPANFAADGDFSEWDGIMPFVINPTTGHVNSGTVDDEDDLSGTVYLAVDDDYLYFAADVVDDTYYFGEGNWWDQDAMQLFIGLYDWRGPKHTALQRGDEPDYIIYTNETTLQLDNPTNSTMGTPGDDIFYFEGFNPDYATEGKISLDTLAARGGDARFHPVNGMRIPIDIYFHDNDGSGWEGNVGFSPLGTDQQWNNPREWAYTWIGDLESPVAVDDDKHVIADQVVLYPNYPNPFNPTTQLRYDLPEYSHVRIMIYDLMGRKIRTLVDMDQKAGYRSIQWNATNDLGQPVSAGMYLYTIQTGEFRQTRKMVLLK